MGQSDVFSELCWELDSVGVEEIPQEDHTRFRAFFDSTQSIQSIEDSFNALARDHSIPEFRVTRLGVDPDRWVREYKKQLGGGGGQWDLPSTSILLGRVPPSSTP